MGRIADETESLIERVDLVSKARHEVSKVAFSCVLGCLNTTWLASQVHSPLAVDLIEGSFLIYISGYAIVLQPLRQVFAHLHQSQTFSKSPHETLVAGSMLELGHMGKYVFRQVFVVPSDAQFILLRKQRAQLVLQYFFVYGV